MNYLRQLNLFGKIADIPYDLIGETDPTSATEARSGMGYFNKLSRAFFICVDDTPGAYIWIKVAGGGSSGENAGGGEPGVGITSITPVSTSDESNGVNIYAINLTDGSSYNIEVRNGSAGKDYVLTEADKAEIAGMVDVPTISDVEVVQVGSDNPENDTYAIRITCDDGSEYTAELPALITDPSRVVILHDGTPTDSTEGAKHQLLVDTATLNIYVCLGSSGIGAMTYYTWQQIQGAVTSVNGKTGAVKLSASDVGALPNTTKIPAKTSEIQNDSGFVTNTVSNLTNYYLKTETYTREEVTALIAAIKTYTVSVVSELPSTGAEKVIYLVVKKDGLDGDAHSEYLWVNGKFEFIGTTAVDLTGYAKEDWVTDQLANYLLADELQSAVENALTRAKNSGEFDGISPVVSVSSITGGHRITITDKEGAKTVDIMDGSDGDPGDPGRGISSIARTSGNGAAGTTDTYTIMYTDNTTGTFSVYNGADGSPGTSPTVAVSDIAGGHRITITDKEGTKTVDVMDGSNGDPGRGITSVKRTSGTGAAGTMDIYTITYSDNTTSTFSVYNGADGKNYTLTEADKTEIAQQAAGLVDVDGVVKSTEQTFTDDEKAQVRTNIGAASASDVSELSDKIEDETNALIQNLTLGYGTDGRLYLYFNKQIIGTGIGIASDETVSGTINEDNNLVFNDNIADGDYTLYFLYENNEYSDAMDMTVSEIVEIEEAEIDNLIPTLVDTDLVTIYNGKGYKEGVRISVSAGGETTATAVLLTGLIPLGNDGDVFHIRGVSNITSDNVSATYQGGYWCYSADGALLNTASGIPAIPTSCIGYDENGDYTITMTHSAFSLLDGTAFIRFQFGLSTGEVFMTRNKLISSTDTETDTDGLGVNLLTSGDYTITLNKRYSGSSKAYTKANGMIAFMIPMALVLNRRIRFAGFEYGARVTESQPLWFTLDSNQNSLGYLTGTGADTGIWGSAYLIQEDDGSCTLPINSSTVPTEGAVTLVINMVVDSTGTEIEAIPDTMSIVIEENV